MGRSWRSREELLNKTQVAVGASETNTVISEIFSIMDPLTILIDIVCTSVTVTNGITAKLQVSSGNDEWEDSKTVSITGNDTFTIDTNITDDAANLPLRPLGRVVVTSGVADAVDVDGVRVCTYY